MPEPDEEAIPLPDADAVAALLEFEPVLRRPVEQLVSWSPSMQMPDGSFTLGYPVYAPEFEEFRAAVSRLGFVVPFAWPDWAQEGMAIQEDPDRLGEADLETLVRLLTMHVRAERFTDGHLETAIERGWLAGILARLRALLPEIQRSA